MKVALARPWNKTSMLIPNHGLGYLASALRRSGHEGIIFDCIRDRLTPDAFRRRVEASACSVVGFQVYTFDLPVLKPYIDAVRSLPVTLIAGGPHPSADPADFLKRFPDLLGCFTGEAETGLTALADILERHETPSTEALLDIAGFHFRRNGRLYGSPPTFVEDLDSLGFPDWEQISPLSYPVAPQGTFTKRLPVAPVIITRGCPYPCTFCAGKLVSGRRIRTRSVSHVISELTFLSERFGIREFHIQDDNFTFHRAYVLAFCKALEASGLDLVWACPNGIRLDSLDEEVVRAMERAGCYSVAVGIESGTQRVLDLMRKQTTVEAIETRIRMLRRVTRWHITGFFILGYPGETEAEMRATIRFSRRLPLDKVNFGILMPLPGTQAEKDAERVGWNRERDMARMSEYRSPFVPEGITPLKFRWMVIRAFAGFYVRPRIIFRFIRQIRSWDQAKVLLHRLKDVVSP